MLTIASGLGILVLLIGQLSEFFKNPYLECTLYNNSGSKAEMEILMSNTVTKAKQIAEFKQSHFKGITSQSIKCSQWANTVLTVV